MKRGPAGARFAIATKDAALLHDDLVTRDVESDELAFLVVKAADAGFYDGLRVLIGYGASVNWNSPLAYAIQGRHLTCAVLLLMHGANPNVIFGGEKPLLHYCVKSNRLEELKLLLRFGAHSNVLNPTTMQTPLELAIQTDQQECAQALIDAGASTFTVWQAPVVVHAKRVKQGATVVLGIMKWRWRAYRDVLRLVGQQLWKQRWSKIEGQCNE